MRAKSGGNGDSLAQQLADQYGGSADDWLIGGSRRPGRVLWDIDYTAEANNDFSDTDGDHDIAGLTHNLTDAVNIEIVNGTGLQLTRTATAQNIKIDLTDIFATIDWDTHDLRLLMQANSDGLTASGANWKFFYSNDTNRDQYGIGYSHDVSNMLTYLQHKDDNVQALDENTIGAEVADEWIELNIRAGHACIYRRGTKSGIPEAGELALAGRAGIRKYVNVASDLLEASDTLRVNITESGRVLTIKRFIAVLE